jgi:hypothetical protein
MNQEPNDMSKLLIVAAQRAASPLCPKSDAGLRKPSHRFASLTILFASRSPLLVPFLKYLKFSSLFEFSHKLIHTLFELFIGGHVIHNTPVAVTVVPTVAVSELHNIYQVAIFHT